MRTIFDIGDEVFFLDTSDIHKSSVRAAKVIEIKQSAKIIDKIEHISALDKPLKAVVAEGYKVAYQMKSGVQTRKISANLVFRTKKDLVHFYTQSIGSFTY